MKTHLFLGGEVVDDVEELADFLWCLSFDHVCDSLASDIAIRHLISAMNR